MSHRLSVCGQALALAAVVLCLAGRSGAEFEALQNGTFDSGLAGWQFAQDVSDWPVQQSDNGNPYISLHPGKSFRGPLAYQNLNISGVGGATVTVSVRLLSLDSFMTCGQSVAVYLDYVTVAGQRREKRLIYPFDCDVFSSGLLTESFTLPADAARITRLSLARMDMWGQMGADDVSLMVPDSATAGPVPQITGLSSSSGTYGQTLTVTGTGFGTNASGQGEVTIGDADAGTIVTWTDSQIAVTLASPAASGPVRVLADHVESNGDFSFTVTSPHFDVDVPWAPEPVISGQKARIPVAVRFVNGYSTASGVSLSLTGAPAVSASFAPEPVMGSGGTLLTLDTTGLAQGDYSWTLTAGEPAAGTIARTVRVSVSEVGQALFQAEDAGGVWGTATSITRPRQGGFNLNALLRDLDGKEITGVDYADTVSWTSSDPSKVLAVKGHNGDWSFHANENGSAVLTVATPDGFTANLPVTVNFPATPTFTLLALNPSTVDNSGSGSVAIAAEATGFANEFGITFPGEVNGSYSNGGLRYDATGTVGARQTPGNHVVSVGNLWDVAGRAAVLTVNNDPSTGIVRGFVSSLQPPDQSGSLSSQGTVFLHDAATGAELRTAYAWSWQGPGSFAFAAVPPGTYKLRLQPPGVPEPPYYLQPQWYPNASDLGDAAVISVSAGQEVDGLNLFYTDAPKSNPVVVSTIPQNGETDVPLNASIVVQFDQAMEDSSLLYSSKSFILRDGQGNQVSGARQLTDSNGRALFTPDEPLEPNSQYTVSVTTFAFSVHGLHLLEDHEWTFATGSSTIAPLGVVETYPAAEATDVSSSTFVSARFNRAVDPSSVTWDTVVIQDDLQNTYYGDVDVEGDILVLRPYSMLNDYTHYTVTILGSVSDQSAQPLGADYGWSFTTGVVSPPRVIFTVPADGTYGVPADSSVTAYFDQWMNEWSFDSLTFHLQDGSANPVSGTVSASGWKAVFTPDSPLSSDMEYTATLTTGVQSSYGYALEADYLWWFSTASPPSDRPQIVEVYPAPQSTDAVFGTYVMVLFDRELDANLAAWDWLTLTDEYGNPVPGTIYCENRVIVLSPWVPLSYGTYTAAVSGSVAAMDGTTTGTEYSWQFYTAGGDGPPRVVFTVPAAYETDVSPGTFVTSFFDQPMRDDTISDTTFLLRDGLMNDVPGWVSPLGYGAMFQPYYSLDPNTSYTATLTSDIQSNLDQPLPADYTWTFETGPPELSIWYTSPYDGETDVSPSISISAFLSTDIDPSSVNAATFIVRDGNGDPVSGSRYSSFDTVEFQPDVPLLSGTTYTVTLGRGLMGMGGERLRSPFVWTFTTGEEGPRVTDTTPYGDMLGWWLTKPISASFSTDMDSTTLNSSTFLLRDAADNPVPGSVTTELRIATFAPSAPLVPGIKYTATITTGAKDLLGVPLPSDFSWSFTAASNSDNRLGAIKALPDGTRVAFTDKALHYATQTRAYVEDLDRSSGIRCEGGGLASYAGRLVDVSGILMTDPNGERYVASWWNWIRQEQSISPVSATNRAVKERRMDGMLVRVWGTVQSVTDANTVVISDGSDAAGLVVRRETEPIGAPVGTMVLVTGAAGWNPGRVILATSVTQLAP